jgi:hypothetical protein
LPISASALTSIRYLAALNDPSVCERRHYLACADPTHDFSFAYLGVSTMVVAIHLNVAALQ